MDLVRNSILLVFLLLLFFSCFSELGTSIDTITSANFITDPDSIVSSGSVFKLGFFSPINSTNRYAGIWYNQITVNTIIWVANRNKPLTNSSGVLTISTEGNLVVLDGLNKNEILWSSNVSKSNSAVDRTAQLLDSGNFVLKDSTTGVVLWESFKHPSDYYLPKMKISTNSRTNEKVKLTSWKSPSDPSVGSFSVGLHPHNLPELVVWKDTNTYWRSGPWNSQVFIGIPNMISVYLYGFSLVIEDGTYYLSVADTYDPLSFDIVLNHNGNYIQKYWDSKINDWGIGWMTIDNECDVYGKCGEFGICNAQNSPICSCLSGFEPKNVQEWNRGNWSSGCVRRTELKCEKVKNTSVEAGLEDGFLKLEMIKVPYFPEWSTASEVHCRTQCLLNCSCMAYAYETGIGCMRWNRSLVDIQQFSYGGANLYLRLAYSELGDKTKAKDIKVIVSVTVTIGVLIIVICLYFSWRWMAKRRVGTYGDNLNQVKLNELPLFDFEKVAAATNCFHFGNKLGEGGFGPVYRGKLFDGQEIAVKRLSRASGQGIEEFTNEVTVLSKLQHRNLVRLLGCCIKKEEKMLIYEFMPNNSLDSFIFDPTKQKVLHWRIRFNIIEGIARGLLYLHRDSRLKIIHRDLKASNILLDEELNPKISDFGMARIFCSKEEQANTRRVVGTYGYMSPEYAMKGRFSEKSDVYSYGVLLLEIVSGKRNSGFHHDEQSSSLLELAWKLWVEGEIAALIGREVFDPLNQMEILRCIHVGLLCVQEYAKDRPSMSTVLSMLNSEIMELPTPNQPAFVLRPSDMDSRSSQQSHSRSSISYFTVTDIYGR